jgi:hypothetical protein
VIQTQIDAEYAALLSHPIISTVELVRRDVNRLDGYLRVRCGLLNSDFLEIAIHLSIQAGRVVIDSYRYQWMGDDRTVLRRRWDNTPHFPGLPNFPHHCHLDQEDRVEPATVMDVATLLDHIAEIMRQNKVK